MTAGALLGVVINDVEGAADEVVKGNSAVIETGHTIVVGWTPDTIPFLRQVAIAQRENARPRPVVVLADTDKEAMDAELADLRAEFPAFKVLTREGRPTRRADLERVAAGTAERVVVMSGPGESDSLGRSVSAAAWGIQSMRPRGAPPVDVVVGLSDGDAANAGAEISDALGGGSRGVSVTCVSSGSDLGKVLAQAAVHPGLHSVLDSLLEQSFSSPEFYVASAGGLGGRGYGEVRRAWPKGAVVGIIKSGQGRSVMLNPRDDVAVHKDDKIIVVCQDLVSETCPDIDRAEIWQHHDAWRGGSPHWCFSTPFPPPADARRGKRRSTGWEL